MFDNINFSNFSNHTIQISLFNDIKRTYIVYNSNLFHSIKETTSQHWYYE